MTRRPRVRSTTVRCPECRSELSVRLPPLVYIRLTRAQEDTAALWWTDCGCGRELTVTVGDAHRAA